MFARPPLGWRSLVALLGLVLFARPGTSRLCAQAVIGGQQALAFGSLRPGQTRSVPPNDVVNRAELVVDGKGKFNVSFNLPANLTRGPGGPTLTIGFGAGDGIMIEKNRTVPFNPVSGTVITLNGKDPIRLCVGGTVTAAPTQAAGTYDATITVILTP